MAGRGKAAARGGNAGRGNNNNTGGRGGRGGRGTTRVRTIKTGLKKELEGNIFDLGERSSADLMRTTQIKIAQYIGSMYGGDIMGELETKTEFVTPTPEYPQSAKAKQAGYETMIRATQQNALAALKRKEARLRTQLAATSANKNRLDRGEALGNRERDSTRGVQRQFENRATLNGGGKGRMATEPEIVW